MVGPGPNASTSPLLGPHCGLGRGWPFSTPGTALKKTGDRAHLAGLWRDLLVCPSGSRAPPPTSLVSASQEGKGQSRKMAPRAPPPELDRWGMGLVLPRNGAGFLGPLPGPALRILPSPMAGGPGQALCIKWRGHDGDPGPWPPGPPVAPFRPSAGATEPQAAGDAQSCPSSVSPPRAHSSRTGRSGEKGKRTALVALSEASPLRHCGNGVSMVVTLHFHNGL